MHTTNDTDVADAVAAATADACRHAFVHANVVVHADELAVAEFAIIVGETLRLHAEKSFLLVTIAFFTAPTLSSHCARV